MIEIFLLSKFGLRNITPKILISFSAPRSDHGLPDCHWLAIVGRTVGMLPLSPHHAHMGETLETLPQKSADSDAAECSTAHCLEKGSLVLNFPTSMIRIKAF